MVFDRTDHRWLGGQGQSLKINDPKRIGLRLGSQSKGGLQILYIPKLYIDTHAKEIERVDR